MNGEKDQQSHRTDDCDPTAAALSARVRRPITDGVLDAAPGSDVERGDRLTDMHHRSTRRDWLDAIQRDTDQRHDHADAGPEVSRQIRER